MQRDETVSGGAARGGGGGPDVALWGRDEEIELIDRHLAGSAGVARGVVVLGEPGIGKSSLWARGVTGASRAGMRVLATTCVEAESEMPYAGLVDLFGELLDDHGAALPEPQRSALDGAFLRAHHETAADSRTVAAGVVTLLRRALVDGPVLLAVDDLHWLDAETHTCLAYAARRLEERGLVLLVTSRDRSPLWCPPRDSGDEALLAAIENRSMTLRLGPLPGSALRHVLSDRLGVTVSVEESSRIAAETGGNPFWTLEFGQRRNADADGGGPSGLSALVTDRIARLERDVVDTSCLVAALGRPRTATVLSDLSAGVDPDAGEAAAERILDRAVAAGLLTVVGGRLTPTHPLIGAALVAGLPPFRRRRLYRRAAALADSAEARALHLLRSIDDEDPAVCREDHDELLAALDGATTAARLRGAASTAARFAARALALVERDGQAQAEDRSRVAETARDRDVCSVAARRVSVAELHHLAEEPDKVLALLGQVDLAVLGPDLLERAGPLMAQTTNRERGGPAARAVVDALDELPRRGLSAGDRLRREALISTLRADMDCGAVGDRRAVARRAVEQAEASATTRALRRRALGALAYALQHAGDPVDDVLARLEDLGPPGGREPGDGLYVELNHGLNHRFSLDLPGARRAYAAGFERLLATGHTPGILRAGDLLASVDLMAGRPAAAEATLIRIEEHVDPRSQDRLSVLNARGDLHLVRGEHDAVEELLDRHAAAGCGSARCQSLVDRLRGLLAWQRDDPERAAEFLLRFATTSDQHGIRDPDRRRDSDDHLAEALIAVGDHDRAARIVDELAATTSTVLLGQHRRVLAQLVVSRDHDLDRALALAHQATVDLADCPMPARYGRSLVTLASIHRLRGEPDAAGEHRRRAHELFTRIGYTWWATRTADPARAELLSSSERAVTGLVTAGATNRETAAALHLSVRTVENHLRSVYRKLGIGSRGELARSVRTQPTVVPPA